MKIKKTKKMFQTCQGKASYCWELNANKIDSWFLIGHDQGEKDVEKQIQNTKRKIKLKKKHDHHWNINIKWIQFPMW